jgi:dTMP kinase
MPDGGARGVLVTLEGGEGAGKSYQLAALAAKVQDARRTVVCTREPGGTPLGERLRKMLLEASGESAIDPLAEALLFVAARSQLMASVISPALGRGDVVLCDRFIDSTLAYQGYGRGVELMTLEKLNAAATGGMKPHLTVLLDLPVDEGMRRNAADSKRDRFESEALGFHERVRTGYLSLAKREPERWLVVDADQPPDAVTEAIWARLAPLL